MVSSRDRDGQEKRARADVRRTVGHEAWAYEGAGPQTLMEEKVKRKELSAVTWVWVDRGSRKGSLVGAGGELVPLGELAPRSVDQRRARQARLISRKQLLFTDRHDHHSPS